MKQILKSRWVRMTGFLAISAFLSLGLYALAYDAGGDGDGDGGGGGGCVPSPGVPQYENRLGAVRLSNPSNDKIHQSSNDICSSGSGGDRQSCYRRRNANGEWEVVTTGSGSGSSTGGSSKSGSTGGGSTGGSAGGGSSNDDDRED